MSSRLLITHGYESTSNVVPPGHVIAIFAFDFDQFPQDSVRLDFAVRSMINNTKVAHTYHVRIGGTFNNMDGEIVIALPWIFPGAGPIVAHNIIPNPRGLQFVTFSIGILAAGNTTYSEGYTLSLEGVAA